MSETPAKPASEPTPAASGSAAKGREQTVIGPDTKVKGEMTFDHDCRVLGHFEGSITAEGQLHVAEGATCKAEVEAESVIVDGRVEGNISAKQRVKLNASAEVHGDVVAGSLEVADGATISGHVSVGVEARGRSRGGVAAHEAEPPDETSVGRPPRDRRAVSHKPNDA